MLEGEEFIISQYSRAQAIADGVLVDASKDAKATSKIVWNLCLTAEAHARVVLAPEVEGGLVDVCVVVRLALNELIRAEKAFRFGERVKLRTIYRGTLVNGFDREPVELHMVIGPDDNFQPCLTVMLPHED